MRLATVEYRGEVLPVVEVAGGMVLPLGELMGSVGDGGLVGLLPRLGEVAGALARWEGRGGIRGDEVRFLPPVPRPATFRDFYAFEAHVKTARGRRGLGMEPAWYERPVFYFSNPVSLVGHGAAVWAPAGSVELDYELEVGVVIGKGGRDLAEGEAWGHVAGLTIVNDFSARDLQRQEMKVGLGPCKGKDFCTAVGPWLVPPPSVPPPAGWLGMTMVARVNGRALSRGNLADLHFPIPRLIAEASRDAELLPGDLIGTGTVGTGCILELGVETTGGWLRPGDVVELEVEGLGVLRNRIVGRRGTDER